MVGFRFSEVRGGFLDFSICFWGRGFEVSYVYFDTFLVLRWDLNFVVQLLKKIRGFLLLRII